MKVAFVYDRVNKWGGAERVLSALHEIWPDAPLYTAVYNPRTAQWANGFQVHSSFLQYLPFAKTHHEWYPWLTPLAFESFSFDGYDVVISITSAEAKNIITKPGTVHICYCLTPTRYLWSGEKEYEAAGFAGNILRIIAPTLRQWDIIASSRPDYYVAISRSVEQRIQQYYHRPVDRVLYPPVDTKKFAVAGSTGDYFLCVSRLVPYKRVDIVIDAFNRLGWPLVVIGNGWERPALQKRAWANIQFVTSHLTDDELVEYYRNCRALVFAGEEDFGLVAVEAQAAGKPVVAYRNSGMGEIVVDRKTGLLFAEQTVDALVHAVTQSTHMTFDEEACRENAQRFRQDRFRKEMQQMVDTLYKRSSHWLSKEGRP